MLSKIFFSLSGYDNNTPYPSPGFEGKLVREEKQVTESTHTSILPSSLQFLKRTNFDLLVIAQFCTAATDDPVVLQQQRTQIIICPAHTRPEQLGAQI